MPNKLETLHDVQMSNPARPPKELSSLQLELRVAPDSYFRPEEGDYQAFAMNHRAIPSVQGALFPLDMTLAPSFGVPAQWCTDSTLWGDKQVKAVKGLPVPRVRSAIAKNFVNKLYELLPETGFAARQVVHDAMLDKVYCSGGTENTLGRLAMYYPRRGARPSRPVTWAEAREALGSCGVLLDRSKTWRPRDLTGPQAVFVNPSAENGFPVMGNWRVPADAAGKVVELALSVRRELEAERDIALWLKKAQTERPWLVALRGKAKADYYSKAKVRSGMMRFYNVFPRQMMMNMQMATQVLEGQARSILDGEQYHSFIGATLAHGGAADVVAALEVMLKDEGAAYVHCGDDSWVILRRQGRVVMFALDCSSFDLTQHSSTTEAIHRVLRDELAVIDPVAADLWHAYARQRLVVVANQQARVFKHAGASGMPLQSKVNDLLMDVMLQRLLADIEDISQVGVATRVHQVAAEMGFVAKLEQFVSVAGRSVVDALKAQPFLFVGYYFHVREERVQVFCDVPRMMAQLPFPSVKWAKGDAEFAAIEAMRIGSVMLNLGIPPVELVPFFEAGRHRARELVSSAIFQGFDVTDERLRYAVQEHPAGLNSEANLKGLLRVLEAPAEGLWLDAREGPPPVLPPVAVPSGRARALPQGRAPFPPATLANDGRPPPTSLHPPGVRREGGGGAGPSRGRRRDAAGAPFEDDESEVATRYDDEDAEYEEFERRYADSSQDSADEREYDRQWG